MKEKDPFLSTSNRANCQINSTCRLLEKYTLRKTEVQGVYICSFWKESAFEKFTRSATEQFSRLPRLGKLKNKHPGGLTAVKAGVLPVTNILSSSTMRTV